MTEKIVTNRTDSMLLKLSAWSKSPGPRYKKQGDFSAEELRDEHLLPALTTALILNKKLLIDLDGVSGLPPSFLEELFGGLVRATDAPLYLLKDTIWLRCYDEPGVVGEIVEMMNDAETP